ncbi:MAG: [FeFe] hydrogenase, group A [Limnochordia bacterium]|nr:[FeFe] hydrogenase, group A [Limnochordia bacterium]
MGKLTINNREVTFTDEKNLLEVIRHAGIDLPTFCYHSELSVYGGCRMCVVEIDGMGVVASCSTPPSEGMVVRTHTDGLQKIRKLALELILADHDRECTTCKKSGACKLQDLSHRLGVEQIRFGHRDKHLPIDESSPSIVRDPNKCILCGDCVRMCEEVQGIGILGFANRGSDAVVTPAFGKNMAEVDCVSCGQCAAVCPTGALTVKYEYEKAFEQIAQGRIVIAQIAPAVRVAVGEAFGLPSGENSIGKLVAALKHLGFSKVFDTSVTADLTVLEETEELIERVTNQAANLPLFTSCCPAWVTFAEQYYPNLLPNLSTCRSPQQMFGSVVKRYYAEKLGVKPEDIYMVSIMPCTAKKFEAKRSEFTTNGVADVDLVLTTQEIVAMLKNAGIDFAALDVEPFDSPLGFATGAGIIFGVSGGVSEAVLRYAAERLGGDSESEMEVVKHITPEGITIVTTKLGELTLRLAVVSGLANARKLLDSLENLKVDVVEVMACPGGCINGAGQPQSFNGDRRKQRTKGLISAEKMTQLRKSQQNPTLLNLYNEWLDEPGSAIAHRALHTEYKPRRRLSGLGLSLESGAQIDVEVCIGTCCYLRGSYDILQELSKQLRKADCEDRVNLKGTFCFEQCSGGPMVRIGDTLIGNVTLEKVPELVQRIIDQTEETH